jgi:hypothetical protein
MVEGLACEKIKRQGLLNKKHRALTVMVLFDSGAG